MVKILLFMLGLLSVLGGFWCLILSVENYMLAEITEKRGKK